MVKAYDGMKMQLQQTCYRTYSHAGFPKGSYTVHNPVHFHIAKYNYTANRMQPALVKIPPQTKRRIFNSHTFNRKIEKPSVTIKIGNTREISLNISMQTLQEFIFPLASALNFINIPMRENKSSQTSYISSYVPNSSVKNNRSYIQDFSSDEDLSDFEYNILRNLRYNLIHDLSQHTTPAEMELLNTFNNNCDAATQFSDGDNTEADDIQALEPQLTSLADQVSDNILSITKNVSQFEEVVHDAMDILKQLPYATTSEGIEDLVNSSVESNTPDNMKQTENVDLLMNMNEDKSNNSVDENVELDLIIDASAETTISCDEGYNDTLNNITNRSNDLDKVESDETVLAMSQVILDYLIKQGFEIKELVLFPEVLYDQNIHKLFSVLRKLYYELCGSEYSDECKNELRIRIGYEVLKKLQVHDSNSESNSDDSLISDKLFSISEFLSDILDHFLVVLVVSEMIVSLHLKIL